MPERRRSPRFGISQLIEMSLGRERFRYARGINISEHGLLCEMPERPAEGAQLSIMLELPGTQSAEDPEEPETVQLEGIIARVESGTEGYKVGIEFAPLPAESDRERLRRFIATLQEV